MILRWTTALFLAGSVWAANPKGCAPSSLTTITTTKSSTRTSTSTSDAGITSYPDSCTFRPTQTFYSSSGCAHTCDTGFCVIDAPATISCGCPTVFIQTQTVTVCPTATPCRQCYTGWGTFLYTEPCSTRTATATATPRR